MFQRFRDLPDQGLYGVVGVLAVAALYVIGFVIKNSKHVSVDFVLFSAGGQDGHARGGASRRPAAAPRRVAAGEQSAAGHLSDLDLW